MKTMLQLGLTVVASMLVAIAGLYVVQTLVPLAVLRANNEVAGNYLQTLGTIYAVLLAFVVFVVWTQYNEAAKFVEREADELADVIRYAGTCPAAIRTRILDSARAFVREQIEVEWLSMARGKCSPRADQLLDAFWRALAEQELGTTREEILFAEAVSRFNELCDARTDLLQSSRTRLPPIMWILLLTGALSTVASMYLFGLGDFASLALMTASLAGCVSFVLFLIHDLDNPFTGDWRVTPEPIRLVLELLDREVNAAGA
jgi:hypothetical protein